MTKIQNEIINLISASNDPEKAIEIAASVISEFVSQIEGAQEAHSACHQESCQPKQASV